jgi:putative ABC transport system permease protein
MPSPYSSRQQLIHVTPPGGRVVHLLADVRPVTGGYFATLRLPILAGRTFSTAEGREGGHVVIVGESMAARLWPGISPLRRTAHFRLEGDSVGEDLTVIGVAKDARLTVLQGDLHIPEMYLPFATGPIASPTALVRFENNDQLRAAVTAGAVRSNQEMSVGRAVAIDEVMRKADKFGSYIRIGFTLFGAAGLLMVGIGLYGVIAFAVARRTHEIGVRLAVGADRRDIMRLVMKQGLAMTFAGTVAGLVASLASGQLLRGLIQNVNVTDPRALVGVIVIVTIVSIISSYVPGRRAANLDPLNALRSE